MVNKTSIKITSKKLNQQNCYDFVQDASCGGITLFVGTVEIQLKIKP
jgi:molybdopterin synthase catalytic subunit